MENSVICKNQSRVAIFHLQPLCTSAHLPAQKAAAVLTFSCSLHKSSGFKRN